MQSTNECLEICKSEPQCKWLSYYHTNGLCSLFLDCPFFDSNQQVISGESTCDYIQCNLEGQCIGVVEDNQSATTETDCQTLCIEFGSLCAWYSYDPDNEICVMYSTCDPDNMSTTFCPNCVSGQPVCIIEEDGGAPPTTTTTTAAPTTTTSTVVANGASHRA